MHPNALLDSCTVLLKQVLRFDHPADMVVSRHFREQRLGPRERATVAETIYGVLRKKNLYTYLAQHGSGPAERRLAILGFAAERDFLLGALTDQEKDWLARCDQVKPEDLMELHRHNLPAWLVEPLKEQLGGSPEGACESSYQNGSNSLLALGPSHEHQAGLEQAGGLHPRRHRGAG
jgi:16S rRNA (cytosine967-C5)-methyltransferase